MKPTETDFERLGGGRDTSLVAELAAFVMNNRKWWLVPILVALGGLGLLALAAGTGAAPFIYTLF